MTLYYNIVFALLIFEMGLFVSLAIPMPLAVRHKYLTFIAENWFIKSVIYWLKIVFVFVLLLFVDSVNRVYRVQEELRRMSENKAGAALVATDRSEIQARRFYSQRNMYLCGFTIFLSFVLNLYLDTLIKLTQTQEELKGFRSTSKGTSASREAELEKKVSSLERELEKKNADLQAMKNQTDNLQREYLRDMPTREHHRETAI